MSALGQLTARPNLPGGLRDSPRSPRSAGGLERLAADSAIPFLLLAAYGMFRWQTLLPPTMRGRLVGLLALGVAVAVLTGRAFRVTQPTARTIALLVAAGVATLAMVPMSGFPLSWAEHLRIAVTLRAIGDGIRALPGVTVPYAGPELATRSVIALGAGLLLVGGALALATAQLAESVTHRAMAALPLVVLAAVPSALGKPTLVSVHGVALLLLLALFLFWQPIVRRRVLRPVAMVALATLVAVPISGVLGQGRPWFSLSRLVSGLGPAPVARFNWSQTYGPLGPADTGTGAAVLRVRARFPSYWKAEDLDEFDGFGWSMAAGGQGDPLYPQQQLAGFSRAADSRWVQELTVTIGSMRSSRLIAAGVAGFPIGAGQALPVVPASSPGTWRLQTPLRRGDSYSVEVYTPQPAAPELASAGLHYPVAITATELGIQLPHTTRTAQPPSVDFAQYGAGPAVVGGSEPTVTLDRALLAGTPFERVYRLAQRLEAGTSTPYQYVLAVLRYLSHGYTYTKHPPVTRNPIPGFLFDTRAGYCQQFAGSMALLLRMGGVPARVAVGFSTGRLDRRTHEYVVTGKDAHAWVEAWFPKYGWVSFDPTPAGNQPAATLPVDTPHRPVPVPSGAASAAKLGHTPHTPAASPSKPLNTVRHAGAPRVSSVVVVAVLVVLLGLVWWWLARLTRRPRSRRRVATELLVRELEAAFARCGRPLRANVTLTTLERRLAAGDAAAAEYVARLRGARFAGGGAAPTREQRRALRAWLAQGMGPVGRLRALWALPPRRLH